MTTPTNAEALDAFERWLVSDMPVNGIKAQIAEMSAADIALYDVRDTIKAALQDKWKGMDHPDLEQIKKNGVEILLVEYTGTMFVARYDDSDVLNPDHVWVAIDGAYPRDLPTHWMPLPAPPVDGEKL